MSTLTRSLRTFARAEDGATTAEYGIIIVVVAGIAIFVLAQLNSVARHPVREVRHEGQLGELIEKRS